MLTCNGFYISYRTSPTPRGLYPVGEGAGVGLVVFRLASVVQGPVFGKSNSWSGSLIVSYNFF